jgi:hypothetical protein
MVEAVLAALDDHHPSALHAPDRCAVQFIVEDADGPDDAVFQGVAVWRLAARAAGFVDGDLVRVEVKTPAELMAEYDVADAAALAGAPPDEHALASAYEATRRLVRARSRREVVSVLAALVRQLGGATLRPRPGDPRVLDYDLSFGVGEPMVAAADPCSVARLYLEEVLPAAVADAKRVVDLLGAATPEGAAFADLDWP